MNIEAIADALGLKKAGAEYKGPCPLCGGHDRFHIKEGQQTDLILLCRHGCQYTAIMRELEERDLVPKGDYKPQFYKKSDLNYCDALIMVAKGNLEQDMAFNAKDMLALSRMVGKVDAKRQMELWKLIDKVRGRMG